MLDTPQIAQTAAQPVAVLHLTIPRREIQNVMGPGYQEVMDALAAQGVAPNGPWFTHHFSMSPDTFDFEIGVPVAAPIAVAGRVRPGELPAATVARTVLSGGYENLPDAWEAFGAWIEASGHTPESDLWERYVIGPESSQNHADWRTELNSPLA